MGPSRVGGAGLRVSGKRVSASQSSLARRRARASSEPGIAVQVEHATPDADISSSNMTANVNSTSGSVSSAKSAAAVVRILDTKLGDGQSFDTAHSQHTEQPVLSSNGKGSPKFVPRFKGAAEMEERRRLRMLARAGPSDIGTVQPLGRGALRLPEHAASLNPEVSSSEEDDEDEDEEGVHEDNEDDEEFDMMTDDSGDEFDP